MRLRHRRQPSDGITFTTQFTLYRNHLSYVKDHVAEMGRTVKVVYSLRF